MKAIRPRKRMKISISTENSAQTMGEEYLLSGLKKNNLPKKELKKILKNIAWKRETEEQMKKLETDLKLYIHRAIDQEIKKMKKWCIENSEKNKDRRFGADYITGDYYIEEETQDYLVSEDVDYLLEGEEERRFGADYITGDYYIEEETQDYLISEDVDYQMEGEEERRFGANYITGDCYIEEEAQDYLISEDVDYQLEGEEDRSEIWYDSQNSYDYEVGNKSSASEVEDGRLGFMKN
ncbi:unnamed protein product [Blepharisma stoltei]|uniref:Uncharacterized protein n=1 Tax=Blepharisma stoltei TaxID=1481888 RepID=A0AAU9ICX7_9CILI|nr:unnamed protein product [Blepharisma stoltei]